jgi:hypothetical protein
VPLLGLLGSKGVGPVPPLFGAFGFAVVRVDWVDRIVLVVRVV